MKIQSKNLFPYNINVKAHHKYCAYLTIYSGDLLPPFYIGSGSIEKIKNGYHGSVRSKKYKDTYKSEIKNNPHLFETVPLVSTSTRKFATAIELKLQRYNDVVKSVFFFNMAFATVNGMFGMDNKGKNHHSFGVRHTKERCDNMSRSLKGKTPWNKGAKGCYSKKTIQRMKDNSPDRSGKNNPMFGYDWSDEQKQNQSQSIKDWHKTHDNPMKDVKMTKESKQLMKDAWVGRKKSKCEHCGFESVNAAMITRWHNDNCKHKSQPLDEW